MAAPQYTVPQRARIVAQSLLLAADKRDGELIDDRAMRFALRSAARELRALLQQTKPAADPNAPKRVPPRRQALAQ